MTRRWHADEIVRLFFIFLKLGLTSFGGPVAHLGYFRQEFVVKRGWFNEQAYTDIVALCQFLPGPASSQVGMAIGLSRAGIAGALVSFLGFTLPSALALTLFALGLHDFGSQLGSGWVHGLKVVAVAVEAQAMWGMSKTLAPDARRATIAVAAAVLVALLPSSFVQIAAILLAALCGMVLLKAPTVPHDTALAMPVSRLASMLSLILFVLLLGLLPVLAQRCGSYPLQLLSGFYRAGALVFCGGHVVLPLLQAQVVPSGWVSNDVFLAGYGAAQAVPGPLFTFAAFLGAIAAPTPHGWLGGTLCLLAIFAPSFLLVMGALPFWESLRRSPRTQAALAGVNAAVVGLLLAALYQPVWTSAIFSARDFGLALIGLVALMVWKLPPWLVVVGSGAAGWLLSLIV